MEIKAELQKPYTDKQRMDFIVLNNHQQGYEIRETDETLQAWGDTQEELLQQAKEVKFNEALSKAYDYEQNGTIEHKNCIFEMSLSNRQNLKDTEEALIALGEDSTPWNDKNDEIIELSIQDIQYIRLNLILSAIRTLWIEKYPNYKAQIELASTIEEVNAIDINYSTESEE